MRAVRANLHYFDSVLTHDFLSFAEYSTYQLREANDIMEWVTEHSNYILFYKVGKEAVLEIVQNAKKALAAWEGIINDTPDDQPTRRI